MAAEKGHVNIIKVLIQHQANVNACDINDCTPLHDAARSSIHQNDNKERAECIESLVNEGEANINAINIRRETPLHIASEYGSKKLIKRLRKLGADLFATNVQGYNCLEVAIEQNNEEVVRYFIDDESGFDLMRNAQTHEKKSSWRSVFGDQYEVDTPMRKLIREMPKMALLMLNKCSIMVGDSGTNVHKIIFVYEFLEDQYTINDWEEDNFGVQKKSEELMSALYTTNKVDLYVSCEAKILQFWRLHLRGFALTFYMIFGNFAVFSNVGFSYIKTALMLTGDMTYEDQMYNSSTVAYYKLGHLIYIMFAVLMSILVTNLLIGLAVGDIPPLMKQAADERNRLFFELVANFEIFRYQITSFPGCSKSNDTMNYNFQDLNDKSNFQRLIHWMSKFFLGSTNKNDEPDSDANEQIEQQTLVLRALRKQMQVLVEKTKTSSTNNDDDSD
ncbi:unnamed protein product [Adineta steineri]|uniref:Ion transport domain-containing protein n=1 Tax=Adineta steineri TaxID=433720 RepID=A0A819X0K6_9BILA|nr:unnamed protein product [Adineta steineri]